MSEEHVRRVKEELKAAGITGYGLLKGESKALPRVLHEDEHIGGVIYGQIGSGSSAMLVATDNRILFLDKRPLFMTTDELTYDVVSGIKSTSAGPFTSIILHTRINDYILRYVNSNCARIFVKFIEERRLEKGSYDQSSGRHMQEDVRPNFQKPPDDQALDFLKGHDLGVLSTVSRTGNVHGAIVYYSVDSVGFIYVLTKSGTGKGRNVYAHNQVALTIHEVGTLKTLQIQGIADIETNQKVKDDIFSQMIKPRSYRGEIHLPPVTKLQDGSFMVIRINPTILDYHDYTKKEDLKSS